MRISGARILEGEELELVEGYLEVRGGRIERIGRGFTARSDLNLKGGFVLPPLVNAHTHLADAVARELYSGRTQPETVGPGGLKFRVLEETPERELVEEMRLTLAWMLGTGTLAHCDFREGGARGVELLLRAPWPGRSLVLGRPLPGEGLEELLSRADGIGLPSLTQQPAGELRRLSREARRRGKLFSSHVAELPGRAGEEIRLALELRLSFAVHLTHASREDLSSLKRRGVPAVFCPRSNLLLSAGVPPLASALEVGLPFMLGTDNASVCPPDPWEELRFAWACVRRENPRAGGEEARILLKAVTVEPSRLFRLPWGPLEEGGEATFLLLSGGGELRNLRDPYTGLVNRTRPENLRGLWWRGKDILRERVVF
ncbi:MAG: amidohydrolase family protein [Hadesarchaea archaeon]|jgi:cytosine/adenosine deaminase-related metal-dependent hydrolase|nr:amidohydrolase family protein [Hadesarchaea archaeon]